jgi:hypothetical protein
VFLQRNTVSLFRQLDIYYEFFLLFLFLTLSIIYYPGLSFSQSNDSPKLQVLKKGIDERITFPYNASNHDRKNPSQYIFKEPIPTNWNVFINNSISYSNNPEAKTIVQLKEPYPSQKYIELAMFGDKSKKFSVAVNTKESGLLHLYQNPFNGWSLDNPVVISSGVDQGISVTDGKRIVVDKLSLNGFTLGSINVYGKDENTLPDSTSKGSIEFEIIFGHPSQSYIYYMPLIVLVGVGGIVIFLLKVKKRSLS